MSSQHSSRADASGALLPAVILFGGMTLLLVGLLASRPIITPKSTEAAPTAAATTVAAEVTAETAQAAQAVEVALDPAMVRAGESSFQSICSACHGFNAMGIPGLGKALIGSKFVDSQTDDQLLAFLQVGRAVTDPLNTTGVQMPARGGNPNFTDDKLREIIAYIRSLNQGKASSAGALPTAAPTSASASDATSEPFAPLDLSGLAVPTSISGDAGSTTAPTAVPAGSSAEVTTEPFAPLDLSSLPVPTSVSSVSESTAEATAVPAPVTEVTNEPFALPDLSSLPVPTSMAGSN